MFVAESLDDSCAKPPLLVFFIRAKRIKRMIVREIKHGATRGEIDIINGVVAKRGYSAAIVKIGLREVRVTDRHFNFTTPSIDP